MLALKACGLARAALALCREDVGSAGKDITSAEFDGKTHWHDNEQLLVMLSGPYGAHR